MNIGRVRDLLLALPHVVETVQWEGLVFWVGDKAIGGKMFCMVNTEGKGEPCFFPAGPERFHELCEIEGIVPAPYLARAFWVAAERWDALRDREWEAELNAAYEITLAKLPPKAHKVFALPRAEQKRAIAEARKVLAAKAAKKKDATTKAP